MIIRINMVDVAQLAELSVVVRVVMGSTPIVHPISTPCFLFNSPVELKSDNNQ